MNTRSIVKHHFEFAEFLSNHQTDLVFATETWANDKSGPEIIAVIPNGYTIYRLDRPNKRGGGLAVIYQNHVLEAGIEVVLFNIELTKTQSFNGMLIYRPPGPRASFADKLSQLLES